MPAAAAAFGESAPRRGRPRRPPAARPAGCCAAKASRSASRPPPRCRSGRGGRPHVRHDGDRRPADQERAVALVGLGTKTSPLPRWAFMPELGELAADRERRVTPAVLERDGEHRGGGGLAVRAGHGDRPVSGHRPRPAPANGAAPAGRLARPGQLGVVSRTAVDDHHGPGRPDLPRGVPDLHPGPHGAQRGEQRGVLGVAARDRAGRGRA